MASAMPDTINVTPTFDGVEPRLIPTPQGVWERQPGEADKQWQAFLIYRMLPLDKRSLKEVAVRLYNNPQKTVPDALKRLAKVRHWESRTEAYYAHLEESFAATKESGITKIQRNIELFVEKFSEDILAIVQDGTPEQVSEAMGKLARIDLLMGPKGSAANWMLAAHKAVLGTKLVVGGSVEMRHKVEAIEWKP